jgi:dTDP-4-amino-4,6-dideoxygalactose transaminase
MIPFNKPLYIGEEEKNLKEVIKNNKFCGDGLFTKKCNSWIETKTKTKKSLLTTSCTHALEMTALLANINPGDEIIAPSFTFVSTVNAFVLRGAKIIFVDIRPDTMNIDEALIEKAITKNTKAIIPVHYAGVSCEMDTILEIAKKYKLYVIEDAAQGVMSSYKGKSLGSIGDFGVFSFHETKNYTMGEGGAILINNDRFIERAEIIREKGTNRSKFFRGEIDKYSWVDVGSSYLPSELNAAFLYTQLEKAELVNKKRLKLWDIYYNELKTINEIEVPFIPDYATHNAHMFYIKLKDLKTRTKIIKYLKDNEINTVFHYIPLHSSKAGKKFGEFFGEDKYTTKESERLLRLPMFYELEEDQVFYITKKIKEFFRR